MKNIYSAFGITDAVAYCVEKKLLHLEQHFAKIDAVAEKNQYKIIIFKKNM